MQAVADGVVAVVDEVKESTDFGEGQRDETSADRWRGFWCGRLVGWVVVLVELLGLLAPLFLALCAVMARKVWASMDRVICRCQASQVRTWYWSSPTSFFAVPKHSSMGQRAPATWTSWVNPAWCGLWQW